MTCLCVREKTGGKREKFVREREKSWVFKLKKVHGLWLLGRFVVFFFLGPGKNPSLKQSSEAHR